MKNKFQHFVLACTMCAGFFSVHAQDNQLDESLYELSLEDLMNIPIQSASKKEETLFDAPLSSYTITRSDIERSGAPGIMEALRMAPGVIVREQSNGEYDIHIRGMENLTRTNGNFMKTNIATLVMIDNRPVFNHGLGGTYWESLPVDINDVERIEIVRGPSSPLFGPNAVTGVINIITKRITNEKTLVNANVQSGNLNPLIANASIGKRLGDKFSVIISGNMQDRHRYDDSYYNSSTGEYVPLEELIPDATVRSLKYPNPERSLNKWGVNGYLNYKVSDKTSIDLSLSTQGSSFQRQFLSAGFDYGTTKTSAANLAVNLGGLKFRTSYVDGHVLDVNYDVPHGEYDYWVADAIAEYDFKLGTKYTITPGLSIQNAEFDDTDYVNPNEGDIGYFNGNNKINTTAAFLRSDLNFTKKFRVIAGLRLDRFSTPDDAYLAYEFASTYKINDKNLVRAAVTRSNSGSFLGYNYLNIGGSVVGNDNLDIFTLNMIELGYRLQLTKNLQFDIDAFRQTADNLTAIIQTSTNQEFQNIPTTANQMGVTLSVNFVPNERIQFKPFVTIQKTETKDLPSVYLDPTFAQQLGMPITYNNSDHLYTPGSYGGFYFNYKATSKLNVNLNSYYFSKQTNYDGTYDAEDPASNPAQYQAGQIEGKFILNAKVSYEVIKGLNAFASGRNLFGASSREFYGSEQAKGLFLLGLTYKMN
ncbi:MAG TPA: TonB-dependent receptor [Cyclobacteriaceae bacterium]|nr:TonB-dependent receptor [Cyclobacteriaceae bacterium]